ncbi:MAG TPA: SDR family NAD(P)-dependent oxidoreductase [Alphaproteobacteria bacterium]|jgi:3-oxoacyl-[acyl-carrier protein] reductase
MNKIDLAGRAGIITGGARGIGYAIAGRFLASGAKVALFDRDKAALEAAAASLKTKGTVATFTADVTDETSLQQAFDGAAKSFGKIDIMVNNAGIAGPNLKTWEYPAKDFREVIEIDLIGVFLGCKIAAAHMMKNKYGRIVNIASIAGKEGNPSASPYSAAKAGVIALTKSIGKELATSGVLVNCVTPAAAKTDIFKQITQQHIDYMLSKIPMNRFVEVDEIAALVAWLASEDCSFSTGATFDISGGRAVY